MKKRIEYIDTIRGLSILCILFANITSFGWPESYEIVPSSFWKSPVEQIIHSFFSIFVQSNFYPIFASLFGVSMGIIFRNSIKKGINPYIIFTKRLTFLFVIGTIHAFFVWYGDILIIYAILGFFLLPFYRLSSRVLSIIALLIWFVPNFFFAEILYLSNAKLPTSIDATNLILAKEHYQSGIFEIWLQNFKDWHYIYNLISAPFIFITVFPMFLFGLALSNSKWLSLEDINRSKLKVWCAISGFVGITLKSLPLLKEDSFLFSHLSEAFGGPLTGVFYSLTFILFLPKMGSVKFWFNSIGRMSMSNYLFQSLSGFVIFKVLGLYGHSTPILNILIGMVIIVVQVFLSQLWLKYHRFGPIEFIWRKATYGIGG